MSIFEMTDSVVYLSRFDKPNPLVADVPGPISGRGNLVNEFSFNYHGLGVLVTAPELSAGITSNTGVINFVRECTV